MAEQKIFRTIDDYFSELNSEALKAGVDRCVRHTQLLGIIMLLEKAFLLTGTSLLLENRLEIARIKCKKNLWK